MQTGMTWPAPAPSTISAPGVNGVARFTENASGVTIGPVTVLGAYRAVEAGAGTVVRGLRITGLTARDLQRDGIRLRAAFDTQIAGFDLAFRVEPQSGTNLPEGIAIESGTGITIRDGRVSGFRMVEVEGKYTNGDGIATEADVDGVMIARVTASYNSDAGFDLKGRNIRLEDLTSEGNARNYRFWQQVSAGTLTSVDGRTAVWVQRGATVTIERLVAMSGVPASVFELEGGTVLTVGSCDLTGMAPGSTVVRAAGSPNTVTLGAGCTLPEQSPPRPISQNRP